MLIHLAVVLPLYLLVVPKETRAPDLAAAGHAGAQPGHLPADQRFACYLVAATFTLAYGVRTMIALLLLMRVSVSR